MLIQNNYNRKIKEYYKYDDILDGNIIVDKLNSTKFERHLLKVNRGTKRRLRNNHLQRLQAFKSK